MERDGMPENRPAVFERISIWARRIALVPLLVVGAAVFLVLLFAGAKMLWLLISSPIELLSLYWRGLVAGYHVAIDVVSIPIPHALKFILIGVAFAIAVALLVLLMSLTKRRRVRVFVSYHSSMLATVESLASLLNDKEMQIKYVPFVSQPEHDALLDNINRSMQESDFVVVFPGPTPSFVDHEVLAATVAAKPIIMVLPLVNGGAPNTAQRSYPVFVLESLLTANFMPLRSFIDCLHGGTHQVWRSLTRLSRVPGSLSVSVGLGIAAIVVVTLAAALVAVGISVYLVAFQDVEQGMVAYSARVLAVPLLLFFVVLFLLAVSPLLYVGGVLLTASQRVLAAKIVARQVRAGRFAHEQLSRLTNLPELGGEVLASLWKVPPPPYHLQASGNGSSIQSGS